MGMETAGLFTLEGSQVCRRVNQSGAVDAARSDWLWTSTMCICLNEVTGAVFDGEQKPKGRKWRQQEERFSYTNFLAGSTGSPQSAGRRRNRRISQPDLRRGFQAMLEQHAPVHGVALGATRFGEPELEASGT